MKITESRDGQLARLTLRMPEAELELLRATAYRSHQPVAVLARGLLLRALNAGELPPAAPPAMTEMTAAAQSLLSICHGLTSNFSQIEEHAIQLGEPLVRLSGSGQLLQQLRNKARKTGMAIKRGEINQERCEKLISLLSSSANEVNSLARSLNNNRTNVDHKNWLKALSMARQSIESI